MSAHKKIVVFGAGKIGRAFIGQLFSFGGYEVVFVDPVESVIKLLNQHKQYNVVIKDKHPGTLVVKNIRGIVSADKQAIVKELIDADIVAVSVGLNGLPHVAPIIAQAIIEKYKIDASRNTDIILAENMRDAASYVVQELMKYLPLDFPINDKIGLVETSIGKMVPIMTADDLANDPLQVFAEAYNTLILDAKGFRNPIPEVKGLAPKNNMKAWVDRKQFIHNMGHAMVAYIGNYYHPECTYLWEVLEDTKVENYAREAMYQAGNILMAMYPGEFLPKDIAAHINDLIERFKNRHLGDTIYRVGCDLKRKLSAQDRIATPIRFAIELNMPFDVILFGYRCALHFSATDENNVQNPNDKYVLDAYHSKGLDFILEEISGLDPSKCNISKINDKVFK